MIKISLCGQNVLGEYSPAASDSVDYLEVHFSFSPDWYDLAKTAQFTRNGVTYNVPVERDKCLLPNEIGEGRVDISVFGYEVGGTKRITSLPFSMMIRKSGFVADGNDPIPPTPDIYSQLLSKISQAVDSIPENLSEFENDAGFVTKEELPENLSQFKNDCGFITENDVPTKLSSFSNDCGFITDNAVPKKLSQLEDFIRNINVGGTGKGLQQFIDIYFVTPNSFHQPFY